MRKKRRDMIAIENKKQVLSLSKIRKYHIDRYILNKLIRSQKIDCFYIETFDFDQKIAIANGKQIAISGSDIQKFVDSQNNMGNTTYISHTDKNHIISWMRGNDNSKQNLQNIINNDPKPQFLLASLFENICSKSNSEGIKKTDIIEFISNIYSNVEYVNAVESPAKRSDLRSHIYHYCQFLEKEGYIYSSGKKKELTFFSTEKGTEHFKNQKPFPDEIIPISLSGCALYKGKYNILYIDDRSCTYTVKQINYLSLERVSLLYDNLVKFLSVTRDSVILAKVSIIMESIKSRWNAVGHIDGKAFRWPSTLVIPSTGSSKFGDIDNNSGLLSHIGYHVGRTSNLTVTQRRKILDDVYLKPLSGYYLSKISSEWNEPNSPERLKKLAYAIASFARNAKRRKLDKMDVAIEQWESDLDYLYKKFYLGRFVFSWPV